MGVEGLLEEESPVLRGDDCDLDEGIGSPVGTESVFMA